MDLLQVGDGEDSGVGRVRADYSCSAERPDGLQGRSESSGNSSHRKPSKSFQRRGRHAGNPGSCGTY